MRGGWLVACLLLGSCGEITRPRDVSSEGVCSFNDECATPLVCAARRCRAPCRTDRDCVNRGRCLSAGQVDVFVCYPPEVADTACVWSSHCLQGRVCSPERLCQVQCRADYDCQTLRRDLTCDTTFGVCVGHPFLDDAGVLRDVLRNDPNPNPRDPVVASRPAVDAGGDGSTPGDTGSPSGDTGIPSGDAGTSCALRRAPWACTPEVDTGCDVVDVALAPASACTLFSDGTVRCWSSTDSSVSHLGNGDTLGCLAPGLVRDLTGVQEIHLAGASFCVARAGQTMPVWCWGRNDSGRFGHTGPNVFVPTATPIPGGTLAFGFANGISITAPGLATVWGQNDEGQLGDGTLDATSMGVAPHAVAFPGIERVAMATRTSCGVFTGGELRCWGNNEHGLLGAAEPVDSRSRSLVLVSVPGITNVRSVSVGGLSACVVRTDATVWCWGRGGAVGDGMFSVRTMPIQVLTQATQVVVGGSATCGLRTDGTVWCWGEEQFVGNGNGNTGRFVVPQQVPGLDGVRRLFPGLLAMCAWRGGADLRCWGRHLGTVGAGEDQHAYSPVRIVW